MFEIDATTGDRQLTLTCRIFLPLTLESEEKKLREGRGTIDPAWWLAGEVSQSRERESGVFLTQLANTHLVRHAAVTRPPTINVQLSATGISRRTHASFVACLVVSWLLVLTFAEAEWDSGSTNAVKLSAAVER